MGTPISNGPTHHLYGNGRRADIPVALRTTEGDKLFPGVKWIFPPTLTNPKETVVG